MLLPDLGEMRADGDIDVTSKGLLRASDSGPFTVGANVTSNGTWYHGGGTLTLDDASRPTTNGARIAV